MALRLVSNPVSLAQNLRTSVRFASIAAREVLAAVPDVEVTTLKNGFRVASENNARPTATVGVWIDAGSRFEHDGNNGAAHFLEHMIYKGTGKRSQAKLESDLNEAGARLDSYTSREHTAYYAQCASKDVQKVVDILADVLRNSKLDEAAIEKERAVILRELEEYEQGVRGVVYDQMHAAAFQGTPLAKTIYGTTQNIQSMSREQLRQYIEDNYKPVRMVLSGVGGIDHSQLVSLTEKHFGDLSNQYPGKVPQAKSGVRFTGSEFRYRDDNLPFLYGAVAVEGTELSHPDSIPLQVASTIVGQWDRTQSSTVNAPSRLVQKISHGHELEAYHSFSLNYKDCGLFGVYFVQSGNHLDQSTAVVRAVQREWKHLATAATDEEIDRAKNMLKTNLFTKLECNTARADDIGKQILYSDKVQSLACLEKAIEAVDKLAVREAMSRHVYDRDIVTTGVGRTEAFPVYALLRYGMSWWRL